MRPRQFAHLGGHDAYDILGVDPTATRTQIDSARRALVKVLHPDLPGGDAEQMSLVNAAAAILLDDDQRREYDAYLDDARGPLSRWRLGSRRGADRAARPGADRVPGADRFASGGADRPGAAGGDRADSRAGDRAGSRPAGTDRTGVAPGLRRPPSPRPGAGGVDEVLQRPRRRSGETLDAETLYATGSARVAPPGPRRRPSPRPGTRAPEPAPQLRWQPPPPGRVAVWRQRRRVGRQIARGQRNSPSGGPIVVVVLLATLVAICAIGGVLIGYSTEFGSGSPPAPTPTHHSTPAKSPSHSAKPKPRPSHPGTPSASRHG